MNPTIPVRRPGGVTFAAVLLGIFSTLLVLFGLLFAVAGAAFKSILAGRTAASGAPVVPPGAMTAVFVVFGLVCLALAGWGISTLVGLVRMRGWASVSSIVIGVLLVLFGLFGLGGTMMASHTLATQALPVSPGAPPGALHAILVVYGVVWLVVIAAGLFLFIYFLLRPTREAFRAATLPPGSAPVYDAPYASPYVTGSPYAAPSGYAPPQMAAPSGSETLRAEDFHYAQPLPPAVESTHSVPPPPVDPS